MCELEDGRIVGREEVPVRAKDVNTFRFGFCFGIEEWQTGLGPGEDTTPEVHRFDSSLVEFAGVESAAVAHGAVDDDGGFGVIFLMRVEVCASDGIGDDGDGLFIGGSTINKEVIRVGVFFLVGEELIH